MNWLPHYDFGSHAAKGTLLGVIILLGFALYAGIVKLFSSLVARKRDAAKPENDYWRIHGGD